ncbi:hypothetical protein HPP92_002468 [Vanilla planifolia]|uniref:Mitochondrial splicing suppressor 51-like C-terminal domain-containing protein n=1 Tax=Vanilla planifolia TaxID=51239 RepID=A0A835S6D5_VANPL|nr:hypothetical protein HPP92_002468 [Vanilla planifolia]
MIFRSRSPLMRNLCVCQGCEKKPKRCAFFISSGLHLKAMWKFECSCLPLADSLDSCSRLIIEWNLPSSLCPCVEPTMHLSTNSLHSWQDYYLWRCLPLSSPVALLLHWPLTIYHCLQLYGMASDAFEKFNIHYLGPEKELSQLAVFGELMALLPGVQLQIEFFGPSVPQFRDGETINLDRYVRCSDENCLCKSLCQSSNSRSSGTKSTMTLKLHKGFYHEKFRHMDSHPQLCIAPNAGIAAYPSWLPSIELIKEMSMPAVFTDFCEEAAFLAAECITSITGSPPSIPIQLNPFRQPMLMEDQALCIPCYSNCFLFDTAVHFIKHAFPELRHSRSARPRDLPRPSSLGWQADL